jgi:hypothetical protein
LNDWDFPSAEAFVADATTATKDHAKNVAELLFAGILTNSSIDRRTSRTAPLIIPLVIPAQAGIQHLKLQRGIPAFAGETKKRGRGNGHCGPSHEDQARNGETAPSNGTSRLQSSYCRPQTIAAMPRRSIGRVPASRHARVMALGNSRGLKSALKCLAEYEYASEKVGDGLAEPPRPCASWPICAYVDQGSKEPEQCNCPDGQQGLFPAGSASVEEGP